MNAKTKELIISALDPREPRGATEVAHRSGLSRSQAARTLVELEEQGCVVETTGFARNRAWTRKRTKSEKADRKAEAAAAAYREKVERAAEQHAERAEDALEAIALRAFARLDPETRQRFLERAIDEL